MHFFFLLFFFLFPSFASAQEGLVTCQEAGTCNFCSLMVMINDIISWIVIIASLFSILVIAYAGFLLIFSHGNRAALEQGKTLFFNAIIGIIIMVAGWTIVDTVMKLVLDGDFGMWNQIQCGAGQFEAGEARFELELDMHEVGVVEGTVLNIDGSDMSSCDTSQIVSTNVFGHSVQVHRSLVESLQRIDAAWRGRGGNSAYAVHAIGGYRCTNVADSNNRSYHSYGVAVDINPTPNPHCGVPSSPPICNGQNILITDMPDWFVSLFRSEGWGWGGNWNSSKDAMHFSAARGEQGFIDIRR